MPTYTKEELREMIAKMRAVSAKFYGLVTQTACHPMIEFTGFMNEYIKICERAAEDGVDFTEASVHGDGTIPMHPHEAAYIGEKFGCIFGNTFNEDPKLLRTFLEAAFGADILEKLDGRSSGNDDASQEFAAGRGKGHASDSAHARAGRADDGVLEPRSPSEDGGSRWVARTSR